MLIFHLHPSFETWETANATQAILSAVYLPPQIPTGSYAVSASLKAPVEVHTEGALIDCRKTAAHRLYLALPYESK